MDKFTFKTADGIDVNLEKLSRAFPEVITETVGEDGKIKRVADFEKLKMLLGDSAAERPQEFYEFTWPGKNEAIFEAAKATTKTLRPCPEESKNWDTTQNLYIEGDNLEALKILQEAYLGKVKMIYIDPPYNTGKDFVYRDNFHKSAEEGKADETVRDEETDNNLFQNTESNGRFHSDWCSMISPRLKLARDFLSDDGVIFISIDDNEVHNLRKICDEVFCEENFASPFIWALPRGINAGLIARAHEYVLCYTKDHNVKKNFNRLNEDIEYSIERCNKKIDSRHPESIIEFPMGIRYEGKDQTITGEISGSEKINIIGQLVFKSGKLAAPAKLSAGWTMKNMILSWLKGEKVTDLKGQPITEFFFKENGRLYSRKEVSTLSIKSILKDIPDTQKARKEMEDLFGNQDIFSYPKPTDISKILSKLATDKDSIILDFFSGSATTAHACMQLNAEDGGNRKFIMVQLPEVCAPDSEAAKAGYKNICEIGKERIRRAGEKIKAEHATTAPNLDIGFRVLKIDESIMKDVFYSPNETSQDLLSTLESNIKENRTDLDLLFACLVDWGVELSMPLKTEEINGIKVYTVNDNEIPDLIASFSENITEATIREIAKRKPLRVIFRDSSFADSPSKINVTEIFKTLSPNTTIKVL